MIPYEELQAENIGLRQNTQALVTGAQQLFADQSQRLEKARRTALLQWVVIGVLAGFLAGEHLSPVWGWLVGVSVIVAGLFAVPLFVLYIWAEIQQKK